MEFLILALFSLNVLLALQLVVTMSRVGQDGTLRRVWGQRRPANRTAARAREQRLAADEQAWRFEP